MDGASPAPSGDPMMGGDPMASEQPPMDGQDPAMGGGPMDGEQPPMDGQDPAMGGDQMMDDPAMGGDPMAGGQPPMEGEEGDDSTMSIINQLSDEDKEAVRAYAESMLNRTEGPTTGSSDSMGGEEPPMMESVIFTKKQLKTLTESFRGDNKETEDNKKQLNPKKAQNVSKKSPFNSPKFK